MRVIKFRLIANGEVVGYMENAISGVITGDPGPGLRWWYSRGGRSDGPWSTVEIPYTSREQYTERDDRDGTEIYEGDIWLGNTLVGVPPEEERYLVEWYRPDKEFRFLRNLGEGSLYCPAMRHSDQGLVVGNIHEQEASDEQDSIRG